MTYLNSVFEKTKNILVPKYMLVLCTAMSVLLITGSLYLNNGSEAERPKLLDILLLLDSSDPDVRRVLNGIALNFSLFTSTVESLGGPESRIGLGITKDKPIVPLGDLGNSTLEILIPLTPIDKLENMTSIFSSIRISGAGSESKRARQGMMDAVYQTVICTEIWEPKLCQGDTIRIIYLISVDIPHREGDGNVAGLTEPPDGKCHLKESKYSGHQFDYPSPQLIGQGMANSRIDALIVATTKFFFAYWLDFLRANPKSLLMNTDVWAGTDYVEVFKKSIKLIQDGNVPLQDESEVECTYCYLPDDGSV